MTELEQIKAYLQKRIDRAEHKAAELKLEHGDTPHATHTYAGGWSVGYWEGRASDADDVLAFIERLEAKSHERKESTEAGVSKESL